MIIRPATRTESVKEYYFSKKLKEIAELNQDGRTEPIINLGIGAPDGRPPQAALDKMCEVTQMSGVHKYQSYNGIPELREAFADWYRRYYRVTLDPKNEIQPLTGSKEGILITCLAFLDKGDKVLIPDPGYPTYASAARLCEAEIVNYDLKEENGYQPDFDALESMDLSGVKIMFTNYPNMPTGGAATRELYQKIVAFAKAHSILVVNDNPYSFILNDDPLSILEVPGSKDCCLELNSLSKAHNMSGWRVGMVGGSAEIIAEVLKVKSQLDSGIYRGIQLSAVEALRQGDDWFKALNDEYRARRVAAGEIMDLIGAKYNPDSTGLFLWGKVEGMGVDVSDKYLYGAGVFITPGFIFGKNGEHFVRISLCAPVETLHAAKQRILSIL